MNWKESELPPDCRPPFSRDTENPFAAPWKVRTVNLPGSKKTEEIQIIDRGGFVVGQQALPPEPGIARGVFRPWPVRLDYDRIINTVNACANVRARWDFESSRHIIPVFEASHDFATVIHEIKNKPEKDPERQTLKRWWNGLRDAEWARAIEHVLADKWPRATREEYVKKRAFRRRFYHYQIVRNHGAQIRTDRNKVLLSFSVFSPAILEEFVHFGRMTVQVAQKVEANENRNNHISRYGFWHIILESANAFSHLRDDHSGFPKAFPLLVSALRKGRDDMQALARQLSPESGERKKLEKITGNLDTAFACFGATENRTRAILELPDAARRGWYAAHRTPYINVATSPQNGRRPPKTPLRPGARQLTMREAMRLTAT